MSAEPPPSGGNSGFNPDDWTNANDPIDNQFLAANYLQFPLAQGTETLANTIVSGELTVQNNSTFADLATFNNGIDITTTAGIKFSDTTVQTTAFIEANYAQLNTDNTFLPTFTNTFNGSVDLGTNAIAKTQASGDSSTFVATTAFVQDAVQVSGVQTTDSPLVWTGVNTNRHNAGGSQSSLNIINGITTLWNTLPPATGGSGNNVVISNNGTTLMDNSYAIYCVPNNITGADLYTLTPQLTLSNNGTAMQVKDGINIPTGEIYAVNGVDILAPYAPLESPALTGVPTAPTQALGTNNKSIATTEFVLANSDPAPDLTNYAQLNTATDQTFTGQNTFNSGVNIGVSGVNTSITTSGAVSYFNNGMASGGYDFATNAGGTLSTTLTLRGTGISAYFPLSVDTIGGRTTPYTNTATPPNGDVSTKIATTEFLNDALNGYTTFITTTTTNGVRLVPTLMSFKQVYFDAQYQNKFYLTTVATTASAYGSISFTIPLPAPLYPNGANPTIDQGSYINLVDGNGNSYNFVLSFFSDVGINCNANGAGISSYDLTLSGQIFISWTY